MGCLGAPWGLGARAQRAHWIRRPWQLPKQPLKYIKMENVTNDLRRNLVNTVDVACPCWPDQCRICEASGLCTCVETAVTTASCCSLERHRTAQLATVDVRDRTSAGWDGRCSRCAVNGLEARSWVACEAGAVQRQRGRQRASDRSASASLSSWCGSEWNHLRTRRPRSPVSQTPRHWWRTCWTRSGTSFPDHTIKLWVTTLQNINVQFCSTLDPPLRGKLSIIFEAKWQGRVQMLAAYMLVNLASGLTKALHSIDEPSQ